MAESLPVLVDTHCHLDFEAFDHDRLAVVEAARRSGVHTFINPSVDLASSSKVIGICESIPGLYAAVGVHPNEAATWTDQSIGQLRELSAHTRVVAIGEIGLDYYWKRTPVELQKRVLLEQLHLAEILELPVIIHNREASNDILALLSDWQNGLARSGSPLANRPGVLHSFSGDTHLLEQAIKQNFLIGITGPVTFKNAQAFQHLVAELPLEHIVLETDSPFLSPHPFRGKRNEPARVLLVAQKIAELHSCSLEKVATVTTVNARRLFLWREAL